MRDAQFRKPYDRIAGASASIGFSLRDAFRHVFGMLKRWVGYTHFLTRGLPHVGAEISLNVLAYNFKRLLHILGLEEMMKAMRLARA